VTGIGLVSANGEWTGTVADIESAGFDQCARNWSEALAIAPPGVDPSIVSSYCCDATLVVSLLRAYGAENTPMSYAQKRYGQTIGWPLGAIIDELNLLPLDLSPTSDCSSSSNELQTNALVGTVAALVGLVLGILVWSIYQTHKQKKSSLPTAS